MKRLIYKLTVVLVLGWAMASCNDKGQNESNTTSSSNQQSEEVVSENTVVLDSLTGLVKDDGYQLVAGNCSSCHSLNLVTQNRASREGWETMIRWMQENHKLWDLGANETAILDYLAKNYAPQPKGRRPALPEQEWYVLEEED